jgi:hypothetical protein
MATIVQEEYRHYHIKAGRLSGEFVARAFQKPPVRMQGVIAEATGKSEEAAIEALKAKIEERDSQRHADRRWEERSGIAVPQSEEFSEVLRQASFSGPQVALLRALALSGKEGLNSDQLTYAAGYKSRDTAERVFNKAGAFIADYLGIDMTAEGSSGDGDARMLAYPEKQQDESKPPIWIMHPEMREAVLTIL